MPTRLGQHFLKNAAIIKKIVAEIDPQPDETIIEIGPGHGELTIPLAAACEKIGAKIIAVEKDEKLAKELEPKVAIKIIHADILEFLAEAAGTDIVQGKFKIVGNIPYYLTGHLLRVISELETKPECAILMIQKEVAERIVAGPPRMNRLAASVQFWAEAKIIAHVPRGDFAPPPEVDSAVIKLDTNRLRGPKIIATKYYATVRALFAQPRKTILNNLAAATPQKDKNSASTILANLDIDPKSRPQDLTIEKIIRIASVHK